MQLHEQYRPRTWADVAGQGDAVAAIRKVLARGWGGRSWWITGASGTGKTTLAKLIAAEGASDLATEECLAGGLTPAGIRDLERQCSRRPLPIDGKGGWCIIVNECHGLRKDTVRALLDTLERIPDYVSWIFTTTNDGQSRFFDDDDSGDAAPLVSRCQEIRLAADRKALAKRAKSVAMAAGIDGLPDAVYERCVDACRGNLRMVLQRVESGQLAVEAKAEIKRQLLATPLHETDKRSELQSQLAAL